MFLAQFTATVVIGLCRDRSTHGKRTAGHYGMTYVQVSSADEFEVRRRRCSDCLSGRDAMVGLEPCDL